MSDEHEELETVEALLDDIERHLETVATKIAEAHRRMGTSARTEIAGVACRAFEAAARGGTSDEN